MRVDSVTPFTLPSWKKGVSKQTLAQSPPTWQLPWTSCLPGGPRESAVCAPGKGWSLSNEWPVSLSHQEPGQWPGQGRNRRDKRDHVHTGSSLSQHLSQQLGDASVATGEGFLKQASSEQTQAGLVKITPHALHSSPSAQQSQGPRRHCFTLKKVKNNWGENLGVTH